MEAYTSKQILELKEKYEAIRMILIENYNEEYGDCIINDICEVFEIPPTTVYYLEIEKYVKQRIIDDLHNLYNEEEEYNNCISKELIYQRIKELKQE